MIDANDAPEGYRAVPGLAEDGYVTCKGCDLIDGIGCFFANCLPEERNDRTFAHFKLIVHVPATANWPADDMGTPVEAPK